MRKPFQTNQERLVDEALEMALAAPSDAIRGLQRRPLFLPRYGWPTEQPTIDDVLRQGRDYQQNTNYTGGPGDINAAARNTGNGWI